MDLVIDPVVQSWIAPLRPEERGALETSVCDEGCRDALITWNGTLIDGHHRHAICQAHGIPFRVTALDFADLEHVEVWVRQNQLARRNLTDDQRAMHAKRLETALGRIAKRERADAAVTAREQKAGRLPILEAAAASKIPKERSRKTAAKDHGVSEKRVRRAGHIEAQDPLLAAQVLAGDLSIKDAERAIRDANRAAKRTAAAEAAQAIQSETDATIRHAPFVDASADLETGSVALVFTDPPYHDKTLGVYADLGTVAARVLKPGGSLITYTSHHRIPEVIAMLQAAGLTFFWPLAVTYSRGPYARMTEYGITVKWKPLLWFVKGPFRDRSDIRFVDDVIDSPTTEKESHPWQQTIVEAKYYIEALTQPGDLVFDPFCGGGTTACAAAVTHRRWLTCDVDEQSVQIARARLREAVAA
jgi:SAM-dependent methyltransferase